MTTIKITDTTLRRETEGAFSLSFREKTELVRELDRLGVDIIETGPIANEKTDTLLIRTLASIAGRSVLSVPVGMDKESAGRAWDAVKDAVHPRLLVSLPVSPARMEYGCGRKPDAVLSLVTELVSECAGLCPDVEFSADDATRAESGFLAAVCLAAVKAGARTVTLCDTAGTLLPVEFRSFIEKLLESVPELSTVTLSVECSNELNMAAACVFASIDAGAEQIKCAAGGKGCPTISALAHVFRQRGDSLGIRTNLDMTGLARALSGLAHMLSAEREPSRVLDSGSIGQKQGVEAAFSESTTRAELDAALKNAGYDLSPDDAARVYEAFRRIAVKKAVSQRELDYIVASAAMQVPPTYIIESYVINSGNIINATANILIEKDGKKLRGIACGDGPVDAAFLAIEQVTGRHYELDDFQIEAVTEGREAMGSTVVRLRSGGKLYTGKGVSTDIIGASVRAYVDALNKIAFEENQQK